MDTSAVIALVIVAIFILFSFTVFTGAPFVPSKPSDVKKAFTKLYPLNKNDFLIDLGAGIGTVQKVATRHGAKSIGYELNPIYAGIARFRLRKVENATIKCCNFYNIKFPQQATVVYFFGDTRDIKKIFHKIQSEAKRLNKPLYVISYAFDIPDVTPEKSVGAHYLYKIAP
ncbi:class I SAM-dependent methyltransferase [Candidatus Saccharibacteria bacterium]|nr:class I SAM-dependent methyltransferase [Candidatus Saccharibacteria bacterium]